MITVQREAPDRLSMQEWKFYANTDGFGAGLQIKFTEYRAFERSTTRHKFVAVKRWSTHNQRDNSMLFSEVPTHQDIADEATDILIKSLVFKWRWTANE